MTYDERRAAQNWANQQAAEVGGLFAELSSGPPLASRHDPDTSKDAAERIAAVLTELEAVVAAAVRELGAMTASECETLPRFMAVNADGKRKYAPSTIRHRMSDLHRKGVFVVIGKRDGGGIYELAERAPRQGDQAA